MAAARKPLSASEFAVAFASLKAILKKYERRCSVDVDTADEYFLNFKSPDVKGKPIFFAGTGINKITLSYYVGAIDRVAELRDSISPELRKHLHGKACFRFKSPEPKLFKELAALTKAAFAREASGSR